MPRIAMGVHYDGTAYAGWQRQSYISSVQSCLETALAQIADEPVEIYCAGRTDAGVHATGQVIHFDTTKTRTERAWTLGANSYLPQDISIQWTKEVPDDFHARFSALTRRYHYWIYNAPVRSPLYGKKMTWHLAALDMDLMQRAVTQLIGQHDFSSFRARDCQSHSPIKTIYAASLKKNKKIMVLDIMANGFLHHMVRNIVGTLFEIGTGKRSVDSINMLLNTRDRSQAGVTAPPMGLYLVEVTYPSHFLIPKMESDFYELV